MTELITGLEVHLIDGLIIVALGIANIGGGFLLRRLQILVAAARRAEVDDAATKSLSWGIAASMDVVNNYGWDAPETRQAVIDAAARYAVTRFPDVMKRSSISLNTPPGTENRLMGVLERKLPAAAQAARITQLPPPTPVILTPIKPTEMH